MSERETCETCGGSGEIVTVTNAEHVMPDGSVMITRGHSTSLCACRAGLPLRDGSAQWWAERPVYRASVSGLMDAAEVVVDTEVPVSADNFPLLTRGNRFWPTLVDLKFDGQTLFLTGDQARELALRLIAAADASDACDRPDTDACGHWAPCDCGRKGEV